MPDNRALTAAHIRYLMTLRKLYRSDGIRSLDVAEALCVTKTSVHEMMNALMLMGYVRKERGGQVFMTPLGLEKAEEAEKRYRHIRHRLFAGRETDASPDRAICALIADMSEACAALLTGLP